MQQILFSNHFSHENLVAKKLNADMHYAIRKLFHFL